MIRIFTILRRFLPEDAGSIAPIFVICILGVLGVLGVAVDYSRASNAKSQLQNIADAAVMAGASQATRTQDQVRVASDHFQTMLEQSGAQLDVDGVSITTPGGDGSLVIEVRATLPTTISGLWGRSDMPITVRSTAGRAEGTRVLDVAMCIDATGSMQFLLDSVKANAMGFFPALNAEFVARGIQSFDAVRIRPIFFRDYGGNGAGGHYDVSSGGEVDKFPLGWEPRPAGDARNYGDDVSMRAAPGFFDMETDAGSLDVFVAPEVESGGGDNPESGLECLNEAMMSAWTRVGDTVTTAGGPKRASSVFSVVTMWSDQDVHAPSYSYSLLNPDYPVSMPLDYAGLLQKWDDPARIPQANKVLAFFVPAGQLLNNWAPVTAWDRYVLAGSVSDAMTGMVTRLVDAVATVPSGMQATRLMN